MPSHREKRILPYTSEQLFDLVMDIEKYPQFMPWCVGARVNTRAHDHLSAEVIVGYKMFRERFTSRVHFLRPKHIEVEYMKGPMRHLHNRWIFKDRKDGSCEVDFYVDFSMKAKLLEKVVEQFFERVLVKMINSFETRADELYGEKRRR